MTSFSSKKPIFRHPRSFKSLATLPSVRIEHSADMALFPPEVITSVVVSSLLSALTWHYICVKFLFSNHSPLQFLNLYSPPIRSTPSDSRTRTFSPDILPNSPDTFILGDFNAHHPTWDSLIPPNRLEMTWGHMTEISSFALITSFFLRGANKRNTR